VLLAEKDSGLKQEGRNMRKTARRREDMALTAPNSGSNVWPNQSCPALNPRGSAAGKTCCYCVYADFHLDKPRALDVGICNWPGKKLMEKERNDI